MNILILVRDYKSGIVNEKNGMPAKSGAEIHVERHADALIKMGHKVTIMAKKRVLKTALKEELNNIDLVRLPSGLRSLICIYYIIKHRRDLNVLYIFGQPSFNLTAILIAKVLNLTTVFVSTMTGEAFEKIRSDKYFGHLQPYRKVHNYILKKCSAYIAISKEIGNEFIEHGFDSRRVYVLPQGIDTDYFKPITRDQKFLYRKNLGLPLDKKIVLFCSRLDFRKGIDILFSTWEEIHKQYLNSHLVIVGGGDVDCVKQLQQIINKDASKSITYIGEVEQPLFFFQCADIFVFPSRREGCPNVLMEAMACGCAPIVSRIGGCEDLVVQGKTGILFKCEDIKEYTNAVICLLKDKNKMDEFGFNAVEMCKEKLDVKKITKDLIEIFKRRL